MFTAYDIPFKRTEAVLCSSASASAAAVAAVVAAVAAMAAAVAAAAAAVTGSIPSGFSLVTLRRRRLRPSSCDTDRWRRWPELVCESEA